MQLGSFQTGEAQGKMKSMALIKITNPRVKVTAQTVVFTVLLFLGHLILGDGSKLWALVVSLVSGVLFGACMCWLSRNEIREPRTWPEHQL